jgi:Nucleotidyltransferase domain
MADKTAIWLYGSYARGDKDEYSDCDLLIVGPEPGRAVLEAALSECSSHGPRLSISRYDWHQIQMMTRYGSLFLQHIGLEGRSLWEGRSVRGRLRRLLLSLPAYTRTTRDLAMYRQAVADARLSLGRHGSVPFELAVLATTLRHASVLGCYIVQRANFGRWSAIESYAAHARLENWTAAKVRDLLDYKLWSEGRRTAPEHVALERTALNICDEVEGVIESVEGDARWRGLITA